MQQVLLDSPQKLVTMTEHGMKETCKLCEKANGCSHDAGALPSHLCCQQLLELSFAHTLSVHHCLAHEP